VKSLENKIILIAGASSGIGETLAKEFAKESAIVIIVARREHLLKKIYNQIIEKKLKCDYFKVDLTDEKQVINLINKIEKKYSKIDILINSVGIGLKSDLNKINFNQWKKVFDTNLNSTFLLVKYISNLMIKKNVNGHIITISSMAGLFNVGGYSAYCSSKHALTSFIKSINSELKKYNIKNSILYPYKIDTAFFNNYLIKPNKNQMLSTKDISNYILALSKANYLDMIYFKLLNILKRIFFYLFKKR